MTSPDAPPAAPTSGVHRDEVLALDLHPLLHRFRMAIESIDPRLFEMDEAAIDRVWDPAEGVGAMSCRALVCHLYDTDLVYHMRLRRTLVEDAPVLENFDEDAYLASPLYGQPSADGSRDAVRLPVGAMLASVHTLRQTLAAGLYQLGEADWSRRAMNPHLGETTFREMLAHVTWHFEHHAAFLNAKLVKLYGPRPEPDPAACDDVPEGGCGEGCGCAHG